jgi:hypothetical protein
MPMPTADELLDRMDKRAKRTVAGYKAALTKAEKKLAADNARRERHGIVRMETTVEIDELRRKIRDLEYLNERPFFGWGG